MTNTENSKISKSRRITKENNTDDLYDFPDLSYTLFSYVEELPFNMDLSTADNIYSDELPQDNIEATLELMKKNLEK